MATKTDLQGVHILVVDDTEELREILGFILKAKGANVASASDGAEALNMFQGDTNYDVVLMDMKMPGLSGSDTALKMREKDDKSKIIALTGDIDGEKYMKEESPFDAYVVKPIDPEHLSESILKTINQS